MTCCSLGRRYLLTAAGPVIPRDDNRIGSEGIHELGHGVRGIVQAIIGVMDETSCASGLGGNVEDDEEHERPRDDPSQHLITSQRLSVQATLGGRYGGYSQHSSGQSTDQ